MEVKDRTNTAFFIKCFQNDKQVMLHGESGLNEIFGAESQFDEDTSISGKNIKKKISVARGSLILDQPFFGYLLGHFEIIPVREGIHTFAADTNHLYFNTEYLDDMIKYNDNWKGKIKGILIHLLIHIIYRHHRRQKDKIPKLWAFASDIVVFGQLQAISKGWDSPKDWDIPDLRRVPEELLNHNAERTYNLLLDLLEKERQEDQGRDAGQEEEEDQDLQEDENLEEYVMEEAAQLEQLIGIQGNSCDLEEVMDTSSSNEELEEQYFEGILQSAYERQKGFGTLPEGLDRWINSRLSPSINWKAKLSKYLQNILVHDLTWTRPNKRMYSQGYYFPGPLKENTTVMLGVDTSGSINEDMLGLFLQEAQAILETITNVKLIVVDCDAEIQQIKEYEPGEALTKHVFKGKGGTDFRPVFDLAINYQPDVIVYITDGNGEYPKDSRDIPTIWIITSDEEPPFGEIVKITEIFTK